MRNRRRVGDKGSTTQILYHGLMELRWSRHALVATLSTLAISITACGNLLGRQYEYEEEVFLGADGSASVIVNTSVAALVALRGVDLDASPGAEIDRDKIRSLYESAPTRVTRISRPWSRNGRRFVQIRVSTDDVRSLSRLTPFAWARYGFESKPSEGSAGESVVYRQTLGESAARPVAGVTWTGGDIVAVRLHLPSRIQWHNAPSKTVDRGNIVGWEQSMLDRLADVPLDIEVHMQPGTILVSTLSVFAISLGLALAVLVGVAWWLVRKGRATRRLAPT